MNKIKEKKFTLYRMLISFVLAVVVAAFAVAGNWVVPVIAIILAVVLMFLLKKNAGVPLTDERIEKISGKAARIVFSIFSMLAAVAGLVLLALRGTYPQYLAIGYVLSYSAAGMVLLYTILFRLLESRT